MRFCTLASGSSGNATYIGFGGRHYLVDCGLSGKKTMSALSKISVDKLHGIFVTHEHSDHISGVGVLARRFKLDVFAPPLTWRYFKRHQVLGPIGENQVKVIEPGKPVHIGDVLVSSFMLSHDAACTVGYSFEEDGKKVAVATDLGIVTDEARFGMKDARLIYLESNHDLEMLRNGRYPRELKERVQSGRGHLSNAQAGMFLADVVVQDYTLVYLAHLSEENNTPMLAYDTVGRILDANGVKPAGLFVADRFYPGELVDL